MMRKNGTFTFWLIQHEGCRGRWVQSDLSHFLFDKMSVANLRGELGNLYRALIQPTHDCWQRIGEDGFLVEADAEKVIPVLKKEHPDRDFRIVRVMVTQTTEVME